VYRGRQAAEHVRNGLQLNPDKSEALIIGTANQLQVATAGGRRDEGPRSCAGPSPIVRSSRDIGGQGVQLSRPGHPAHPASSDDRNGSHTGVQPDTVSAGLLQRCVARSSSQQYSEAAAIAEYCGACRSAKRQTIIISATPPAADYRLAVLTYKIHHTSTPKLNEFVKGRKYAEVIMRLSAQQKLARWPGSTVLLQRDTSFEETLD